MADRQRVYEGRPGLSEWGADLGEVDPRVLRAVRAGVKANVMPASPSSVPFAGLLESTKSLPALPHFLGDLLTGGRYGLSEKAPQFAVEASDKYDELINKYLAEEGLPESSRLPGIAKYGLAAGEMLGQLPVPGKMLERATKKLSKAFKPAGWLAEYFGPTVDPKAVNYAVGTGVGGTLRTATGEESEIEPGNIDLAKRPVVRNPDGSVSTVSSIGIEMDGRHFVIPTIVNGQRVTPEQAIDYFKRTRQHLGAFSSREAADEFAQRLHEREAERVGYAKGGLGKRPELKYQFSHVPASREYGAPAHDLTVVYPDDVYGPKAVQYYGGGGDSEWRALDRQTITLLQRLRGKPDAEVTIYRAVPNNPEITDINIGDWVSVNPQYAKMHGESTLRGDYKIISKKVPAKDIVTSGDSIHEFGYNPEAQGFAKGGLGRKPIVRTTAEGVVETAPPTLDIRKEPGGNWLPGSVERIISDRKFGEIAPYPADEVRGNLKASSAAVDSWLETKLANYIKNDMATERDPVRRGIEQRVAKAEETYARGKERIAKNQKKVAEAKARGQDTTAVEDRLALEMADLEQKYELDKLAASGRLPNLGYNTLAVIANERNMYGKPQLGAIPQSQAWENITDASVGQGVSDFVKKRPWLPDEYIQELDRIPSGSNVYELRNSNEFNDVLSHLRDELYNSIRNDSDIPPELKLKPEDLNKMNMDAVVAHVGKVDAWRERNRAAADLLKSRNAATVTHKEYPGTGLEWKELKMPDPKYKVDLGFERERLLQEALGYEGKVMGHCVGSYCPQVAAGKVQIFSLRDAKGEPHVTIEVRPGSVNRAISALPDDERVALTQQVKNEHFGGVTPPSMLKTHGSPEEVKFFELIDKAYLKKYGPPPAEIEQIKGKGNKKPADKYIPFVQDFVRSGKWGNIKDFANTDLEDLNEYSEVVRTAVERAFPGRRYFTAEEIQPFVNEQFGKGYADGGRVETDYTKYNDRILRALIKRYGSEAKAREVMRTTDGGELLRIMFEEESRMADGGRVEEEEYDENAVEEIVAPLRRKLEQFLGEARKVPRRVKQTAADVTEIGDIIKKSKEIPLEYFDPKSEVAGEADAMRHLLFQAQLAQKYGNMPAKLVSYLHEYTSPGQPSSEREMDFYNDQLGREIGGKAKSEEELIEMARRYVESGRAKTLPKEQRGGY